MIQQGKIITILSIDGGGIRGIIPATLLDTLEKELQNIDGGDVRIADYFDIISGTSTGSLIAALLVAPEKSSRRPRTASQIIEFYEESGPQIFSKKAEIAYQAGEKWCGKAPSLGWCCGMFTCLHCICKTLTKCVTLICKAKYDRKHLDEKVKELLGDLKLTDIRSSIVIPAFDLNAKAPVVFTSKQQVEGHADITLVNAVISSSAAPYFFPPNKFMVKKKTHELIDGGIAANNPVLLAIGQAKKEYPVQSKSFECYRILSLGTGTLSAKNAPGLQIKSGGCFGLFCSTAGMPPLVDMMFRANEVITEMYTSTMLDSFNQFPNYLRIQEHDLKKNLKSMNKATPKHIEDLKEAADSLLHNHVFVANACTGLKEELKGPGAPASNREALVKFATMLADVKKANALTKS